MRGAARIVREQQLRRGADLPESARGVQPRRERKADVRRRDALAAETRLVQKRAQTGARVGFKLFEPALYDIAVFAHEGHHVRDRADRDKVGVAAQNALRVALQRAEQLERHADAREIVVRIVAVRALVVHDRNGVRQRFLTLVVVRDDHVDAELPRPRRLVHGRDAAVHRDDERHARGGKLFNRGGVHAVALRQPVGDIERAVRPAGAEIVRQHAGARDAVDVIVAVDRDLFALRDGAREPPHRLRHVRQQQRVAQQRGAGV